MSAAGSPLHLTKVAFGATGAQSLRTWLESHAEEARLTTRYLPRRVEDLAGGSLYWIHAHALIGRSPLLGFEQKPDGRWWIRLEPRLIAVEPIHRRAHQGWRYLKPEDAPADLAAGGESAILPGNMVAELGRLGLL